MSVDEIKAAARTKYELRQKLIRDVCSNLTLSEEDGKGRGFLKSFLISRFSWSLENLRELLELQKRVIREPMELL